MRALLKNKNFTLLFAGSFVSQIGTAFYNFAVSWFILTLTGSPLKAGIYIALGAIIQVIATPIAGVFVDRLHKIRILYITDYIRGGAVLLGALFIFTLNQETHLLLTLYIITVVLALNNAFFMPAAGAVRPELVDSDALNQANAFFSFITSIQTIIGVLLAGVFYTLLGIELIFVINGLSFIISGFTEMFIQLPPKKAKALDVPQQNFQTDFKEGFTYIISKQGLVPFMLAALIINFALTPIFANALPYLFNLQLNKEPIHLSIVSVTFSFGMLVGGLVIGAIGAKLCVVKNIKQGLTALMIGNFTIVILMIAISQSRISYTIFLALFLPVMFIQAIASVWMNVPFLTGIMKVIDADVRGRVMAIMDTLSAALIPLAIVLAGIILEYQSLPILLIGVVMLTIMPYYLMVFGKRTKKLYTLLRT